jgi:hypothetical protein
VRRILVIVIAFLALPAAAAAGPLAVGDGSLGVSGASGTIFIQGRGVIYGHFDSGTLMVLDYKPDDGVSAPAVSNGKGKLARVGGAFAGLDIRFLLPSGRYTIELIGVGIDMSAVGRGSILVTGMGTVDDGSYTVNGGKPQALTKVSTGDTFGGKVPVAS